MRFYKATLILLFVLSPSCVQKRHLKTITFKVDMNMVENPRNVGIRGNFTSSPWNETIFLTDDNNDGIYEGELSQKTAFNQMQFKFVNNDTEYELEGLDNRVINFKYQPEVISYEAVFNDLKNIKTNKN